MPKLHAVGSNAEQGLADARAQSAQTDGSVRAPRKVEGDACAADASVPDTNECKRLVGNASVPDTNECERLAGDASVLGTNECDQVAAPYAVRNDNAAMAAGTSLSGDTQGASGPRPGWAASLDLRFEARAQHTILARRAHSGPLVVQRTFYPEGGVCHAYIVHPPGGVVGGDQLELTVHAAPGSHVLLTTPAATKFYRNAGRVAVQKQHCKLDRATLEWLPQETILYPQATAQLLTCVDLCNRSRFIGWEIVCYGRPASKLLYEGGRVAQDFELWLDNAPLLIDRLRLDGADTPMRAAYGLANHPVLATLLAYPANDRLLEAVRAVSADNVTMACSHVDGVLVARALGDHVDRVRAVMENVWRCLRPSILGRDPVAPRIWST